MDLIESVMISLDLQGVGTKTSYTIQQDIKQQMRAPRKQSLASVGGYIQVGDRGDRHMIF